MDDQIKYYYINMNTRTFVNSAEKLVEQTQGPGHLSIALQECMKGYTIIASGNLNFDRDKLLSVFNRLKENSNG